MLEICPLNDLPPGKLRRVPTDRLIAGFHTEDGDVFAIDYTYAHQDASLADGWLEETNLPSDVHAGLVDGDRS